jgi:hypothetical protein
MEYLRVLKIRSANVGTGQTGPPFPMYLSWTRSKMLSMQTATNLHAEDQASKQDQIPGWCLEYRYSQGVLMYVKQAIHACDRMGLFSDYETARENRLKSKDLYDMVINDIKTAEEAGVDITLINDLKLVKKGHLANLNQYEKDLHHRYFHSSSDKCSISRS